MASHHEEKMSRRQAISRMGTLAVGAAIAVAAGGGYAVGRLQSPGGTSSKVSPLPSGFGPVKIPFLFDFSSQGRYLPEYVAFDKGWYKAVGLDVQLIPGKGSVATTTTIAQGSQAVMGDVDATVLPQATAKGVNVKMVGSMVLVALGGIAFLKSLNIKTPKDLEGKTVALDPFISTWYQFPAFMKLNGGDPGKVNVIKTSSALEIQEILSGTPSPAWYDNNWPGTLSNNPNVGVFWLKDWGLQFPGHSYIANPDFLASNREAVKRFIFCSMCGKEWARVSEANAKEGAQIVTKYETAVDNQTILLEWQFSSKYQWDPIYEVEGYGWVDPVNTNRMVEVMSKAQDLTAPNSTNPLDWRTLYADGLVPTTGSVRAALDKWQKSGTFEYPVS